MNALLPRLLRLQFTRYIFLKTPPSLNDVVKVAVSKTLYEIVPEPVHSCLDIKTIQDGELHVIDFLGFDIESPYTITADASFQKGIKSSDPIVVGGPKSGIGLGMFDENGKIIGPRCKRVYACTSLQAEDFAIGAAVKLADTFVKDTRDKWKVMIRSDCSSLCDRTRDGYMVKHLTRECTQIADLLSKLAVSHGPFDSTEENELPEVVLPLDYESRGAHFGARFRKDVVGQEDMRFPDFSRRSDLKFLFYLLDKACFAILADRDGRKEMSILIMSENYVPMALIKVAVFKNTTGNVMEFSPPLTRLHDILKRALPIKGKFKVQVSVDLSGEAFVPFFKRAVNKPVRFLTPTIKVDLGQIMLAHGDRMNMELIIRVNEAVNLPNKVLYSKSEDKLDTFPLAESFMKPSKFGLTDINHYETDIISCG